jgi:Family of unknown function (DUF695)
MRMDEEHWRPFEGRYRDGMPLVGAVSKLSANETRSIEFPWRIHVTVHCDAVDELGYPTPAEDASVEEFTTALLGHLRLVGGVIEAARLNGHGAREFWWFVRDPEPMDKVLAEFASQPVLFRAFDYDINLDADWEILDRFEPGSD